MNNPDPETFTRAYNSYQANQKQWTFLGYKEDMALAMLTAFFSIGKVRNPSQKPLNVLNVLNVLGKSQVQAIADAVKQQREQASSSSDNEAVPSPSDGA